jgi:hypothetical protein
MPRGSLEELVFKISRFLLPDTTPFRRNAAKMLKSPTMRMLRTLSTLSILVTFPLIIPGKALKVIKVLKITKVGEVSTLPFH